jgi:hypothetical protein
MLRSAVTSTQKSNLTSSQHRLRIPMILLLQLGLGSMLVLTALVDAYPMTTGIPVTSPQRQVNRPSVVNDREYIIHFMTAQQRPLGYDNSDDHNIAWDVTDVVSSPSYLTAMDDIQRVYIHTGGRSTATAATTTTSTTTATTSSEAIRRAWVDKSIRYYSTVMREERRKQLGQSRAMADTDAAQMEFEQMAYKHYFALRKVKDGKPHHAERIYRRIIHELQQEVETGITSSANDSNVDDHHHHQHQPCDHAKFAITTLLLALHMQRSNRNDAKATRSVFLNFFRTVVAASKTTSTDHSEPPHQCACSAKVLQAFALFEMKQGNELKSLEIILHAIRYDPSLNTILNWKQFRDVQARKQQRSTRTSGMASTSTTGTVTL